MFTFCSYFVHKLLTESLHLNSARIGRARAGAVHKKFTISFQQLEGAYSSLTPSAQPVSR